MIFIIGVLIMCVGMQVANYGTAVCLSGEMNSMGATDFYVLVNAFGSLGMMLILPMVGKFTAMFGLRNMIDPVPEEPQRIFPGHDHPGAKRLNLKPPKGDRSSLQ